MPLYISGTNGIGSDNTNWAMTQGTDGVMLKPRNTHVRLGNKADPSVGSIDIGGGSRRVVWNSSSETLQNTGSIYNSTTGVSTITVTGLYYLKCSHFYAYNAARYCYIYIYINGNSNWYSGHYEGASGAFGGQISGTTKLWAGDTVSFSYYLGSSSYTVPYDMQASIVLL